MSVYLHLLIFHDVLSRLRVNLIGEHIDYCGYSVFPMAVQQDIIMAVRSVNKPTISLANIDSSFPDFTCSTEKLRLVRCSGARLSDGLIDSRNV